jgi:signal transduction histidine kinase
MRSEHRRPGLSLAIMIAVLALLPLLAWLQYRWIGQVSEAERERMQASLRTATARFSQEFNGELARAYVALQTGGGKEHGDYAERFTRWRETALDPDLIGNVYLTKTGKDGTLEILKFNPGAESFEPAGWPANFAQLRARLESSAQQDSPRGMQAFGGPVEEEIPALVAPRIRPPEGPGRPPEIAGWTIIELNLEYIRQLLLPALAQRYFAQSDGLDYQLQVVSREGQRRVIYQSDPNLPASFFSSADATTGMLEVRPDFPARFAGPGPGPDALPFAARDMARMRRSGLPPGSMMAGPGRWQLVVRHRLGSLEMAVERARHRNLAISFAVLALMAASIVMLVRSTQRAQRLARLQLEFVAGVSHELRTPLSVICSAADNLADGLITDQQRAKRYGDVIRNEGRRLTEMVEQILGFAGAQAGRMKLDLQPVQISDLIDRAAAAFDQSGCEIEKAIDPDLPLVTADATSLTQCLRNLFSNAVKYGNGSKWIGVRARVVAGGVEVAVEDRGPGINPGDLPHIFEPFYRGREAVSAQIHGTGLGLNLVKRMIEAHSGTVTVTSKPGQGSCFTLRLPISETPKEVSADGAENSAR